MGPGPSETGGMMTSPPFHQDLFDECDARGRAAVTTHFLFNGFLDIKPNPNIYDWEIGRAHV